MPHLCQQKISHDSISPSLSPCMMLPGPSRAKTHDEDQFLLVAISLNTGRPTVEKMADAESRVALWLASRLVERPRRAVSSRVSQLPHPHHASDSHTPFSRVGSLCEPILAWLYSRYALLLTIEISASLVADVLPLLRFVSNLAVRICYPIILYSRVPDPAVCHLRSTSKFRSIFVLTVQGPQLDFPCRFLTNTTSNTG